jgi:hypothetical protein
VPFSKFQAKGLFVNEKNTAPIPINVHSGTIPLGIVECIEPLLTIAEVADLLRWSYDSARRFFKDLPGVLVKYQQRRYKRPYRQYMIPKSVFLREWQTMKAHNASSGKRAA